MWNSPLNAIYLLFSTLITYTVSIKLPNTLFRKTYLTIGILINIGVLFFFKAYEPFYPFLNKIFPTFKHYSFSLPLGLSFYTFQAVSYLVDISRQETLVEKNIVNFSLYHSFFPQLMAGPIERASNLLPQLKMKPNLNYKNFRNGALLFTFGLIKKLVIADRLARIGEITLQGWKHQNSYAVIFSGYPLALQFYFDFSAYSDMAIGMALMMGIKLTQNFNSPFLASSPIEFWRRWHISLMTWLHDYVFTPILNLDFTFTNALVATMIVFVLVGAWHGIALNFIIWGLMNGSFVIANIIFRRFVKRKRKHNFFITSLKVIGTFHLFVISGFFLAYSDVKIGYQLLISAFSFQYFNLSSIITKIPFLDQVVIFSAIPVIFVGELVFGKSDFWQFYDQIPTFFRWVIYSLIIFILIIYTYSIARPYVYFKF
jgi:D-alanyl-lipoteichoic acid acyltransferase DltB (MBOAT superfamily)